MAYLSEVGAESAKPHREAVGHHDLWFSSPLDSTPAVLDGRFAVARNGLIAMPICD